MIPLAYAMQQLQHWIVEAAPAAAYPLCATRIGFARQPGRFTRDRVHLLDASAGSLEGFEFEPGAAVFLCLQPSTETRSEAPATPASARRGVEAKSLLALLASRDVSAISLDCELLLGYELLENVLSEGTRRFGSGGGTAEGGFESGQARQTFESCWERIMGGSLLSPAEIRAAFDRLPHAVGEHLSVGVAVPAHRAGKTGRDALFSALQEALPSYNVAPYREGAVVLLGSDKQLFRPSLSEADAKRAEEALRECDATMAISSQIKHRPADLQTLYRLADRTARLARMLGETLDEGPIVYCEDYSIYLIIDFCIRHYLRSGIGTDVVYLVHPAIIELTRYDAEHRSDLREVLYRFLLCDRSLAKTADAAFMHRNTVLNKITKVESMLGIDLNDARLRQKLILSCQIILYIENVLQRSLGIPED